MDLNDIRIDPDCSTNGVWIDIPDGGRLKIARMNNPNYQKMQIALVEEYRQKNPGAELTSEASAEIANKCIANCILVDWDGITDNGEPVPYSPEKCYEIITDPRLVDFRDEVILHSNKQKYFRLKEIEKDSKK